MSRSSPKLRLRASPTGSSWYIDVAGDLIHLGVPEDERAAAERMLQRFRADISRPPEAGSPTRSVCVHLILDWERRRLLGQIEENGRTAAVNVSLSVLRKLSAYWSRFRVGEIDGPAVAGYERSRTGALEPFSAYKPSTAMAPQVEEAILQGIMNRYADAFSLQGKVSFATRSTPKPKAPFELSRSDIARILLATLGYVWDGEARRMRKSPPGRVRSKTRQSRRHVARMILIAMYTGSDFSTVLRLRWDPSEGGDGSFIEMGDRQSLLHRLGPDAPPGKMAGLPIVLNRRILAHLRRWHAVDRRHGRDRLFMVGRGGEPLKQKPYASFSRIVEDAGLDADIDMQDVTASTAIYLARRPDVLQRSAAMVLGMLTSKFIEFYGHHSPMYQQEAVDAFRRKPRSIA